MRRQIGIARINGSWMVYREDRPLISFLKLYDALECAWKLGGWNEAA